MVRERSDTLRLISLQEAATFLDCLFIGFLAMSFDTGQNRINILPTEEEPCSLGQHHEGGVCVLD